MNTRTKTLALLIDTDNAHPKYIKQVLQFCQTLGSLRIKKAYGDWNQPPLSAHAQAISLHDISLIQQNRVGENATDFALAMDVSLMLDKNAADIYVIVTSDSDFTTVCARIRQAGAKVIGIGSKRNTARTLRRACNMFVYVETIVKNQPEPTPAKPLAPPKP